MHLMLLFKANIALLISYKITYKVKWDCLHCTIAVSHVHCKLSLLKLSRPISEFYVSYCIKSVFYNEKEMKIFC